MDKNKVPYFLTKINKDWIPFFQLHQEKLQLILDKTLINNIYPKRKHIFRIFKYLSPKDIKAVILGQDPYINFETIDGKEIPQAEGLSFSVPKSHRKIPPSLKNIFKEIENSYPNFKYKNGNLKKWVKNEKIFLLNSALTVIPGKSNSHQKYWEEFTDLVIQYIADNNENIVFILMGNNAKLKYNLIKGKNHIILTSVHPSPLSANKGFFGCQIFEKANKSLEKRNILPINWSLC